MRSLIVLLVICVLYIIALPVLPISKIVFLVQLIVVSLACTENITAIDRNTISTKPLAFHALYAQDLFCVFGFMNEIVVVSTSPQSLACLMGHAIFFLVIK